MVAVKSCSAWVRSGLTFGVVLIAAAGGGCSLTVAVDGPKGQNAAVATSSMDSSVATLTRLLESEDPQVRSVAVRGIADMGEDARQAAPHLHRLIDDPDRQVRFEAAKALAAVNPDDPALPAMLVSISNDPRTQDAERRETQMLLQRVRPMGFTDSRQTTTTDTTTHSEEMRTTEPIRAGIPAETLEDRNERSAPTTRPVSSNISTDAVELVEPTTRPISASERTVQLESLTEEAESPRRVDEQLKADLHPATRPIQGAAGAPIDAAPTTRPTTRPVAQDQWSDIPGLRGLTMTPTDQPPPPDDFFGLKSYTSTSALKVKEWIQVRNDLSATEKQNRIKEFQDWRYAQDKLIYQKVLERN